MPGWGRGQGQRGAGDLDGVADGPEAGEAGRQRGFQRDVQSLASFVTDDNPIFCDVRLNPEPSVMERGSPALRQADGAILRDGFIASLEAEPGLSALAGVQDDAVLEVVSVPADNQVEIGAFFALLTTARIIVGGRCA